MVRLLLEKGADFNRTDFDRYKLPFPYSVEQKIESKMKNDLEMIRLLVEKKRADTQLKVGEKPN